MRNNNIAKMLRAVAVTLLIDAICLNRTARYERLQGLVVQPQGDKDNLI